MYRNSLFSTLQLIHCDWYEHAHTHTSPIQYIVFIVLNSHSFLPFVSFLWRFSFNKMCVSLFHISFPTSLVRFFALFEWRKTIRASDIIVGIKSVLYKLNRLSCIQTADTSATFILITWNLKHLKLKKVEKCVFAHSISYLFIFWYTQNVR